MEDEVSASRLAFGIMSTSLRVKNIEKHKKNFFKSNNSSNSKTKKGTNKKMYVIQNIYNIWMYWVCRITFFQLVLISRMVILSSCLSSCLTDN